MFKLLILLQVIALLSLTDANAIRESLCLSKGAPVCGRSGNDFVLFVNECMLEEGNDQVYFGKPIFKKTKLRYCIPDCELECTDASGPVCAMNTFTKAKKDFRNYCEMSKSSCKDETDWVAISYGPCKNIPSTTPRKIVTKKTFKKVRVSKSRPQPVACKDIMKPVCATFAGVKSSFKNECLVNAENIRTGKTWEIFAEGICEEDYTNLRNSDTKEKKSILKGNSTQTKVLKERPRQTNKKPSFESKVRQMIFPNQNRFFESQNMKSPFAVPFIEEYNFDNDRIEAELKAQPDVRVSHLPSTTNNCVFGDFPVCAVYQSYTKSFDNVCQLILENIESRYTWSILHEGPCPSCEFKCPHVYEPICVKRNGFNVTMLNECHLRTVMCKDRRSEFEYLRKGSCEKDPKLNQAVEKVTVRNGFRFTSAFEGSERTEKTSFPSGTSSAMPFVNKNRLNVSNISSETMQKPVTKKLEMNNTTESTSPETSFDLLDISTTSSLATESSKLSSPASPVKTKRVRITFNKRKPKLGAPNNKSTQNKQNSSSNKNVTKATTKPKASSVSTTESSFNNEKINSKNESPFTTTSSFDQTMATTDSSIDKETIIFKIKSSLTTPLDQTTSTTTESSSQKEIFSSKTDSSLETSTSTGQSTTTTTEALRDKETTSSKADSSFATTSSVDQASTTFKQILTISPKLLLHSESTPMTTSTTEEQTEIYFVFGDSTTPSSHPQWYSEEESYESDESFPLKRISIYGSGSDSLMMRLARQKDALLKKLGLIR